MCAPQRRYCGYCFVISSVKVKTKMSIIQFGYTTIISIILWMLSRLKCVRVFLSFVFRCLSLSVTMCSSALLLDYLKYNLPTKLCVDWIFRDGHETVESESSQDRVPFHFGVWVHLWYFDKVCTRTRTYTTPKVCLNGCHFWWRCGCCFCFVVGCVRAFIIVIVFVPLFFQKDKTQLLTVILVVLSFSLSFDALHNRSSIDQYTVCVSVTVYTVRSTARRHTLNCSFLNSVLNVFSCGRRVSICVCVWSLDALSSLEGVYTLVKIP